MIFYLYCTVLGLYLLSETVLIVLNLKQLKRGHAIIDRYHQLSVSPDLLQKTSNYTQTKLRFGLLLSYVSAAFIITFIVLELFAVIDTWVQSWGFGSYTSGVFFVLVVSAVFSIFNLPFSLYSVFVIEQKFGFNKMTLKLWLTDLIKGLLVSLAIITPLLYGLFWFMDTAGRFWWLYAFLFFSAFQLLIVYIYPLWIAPLFNKFERLAEGELRSAILSLTEKLNYPVAEVFQVDGSRRSTHSNAYFTGIGKNKRIVLFDTLISNLSVPQLVAVLAHEIGHQRLGHIRKLLSMSLVMSLLGFLALGYAVDYQPLFSAFGFQQASFHAALVILLFASEPVTYFLSPLFNSVSRRFEYQADRYAAETVNSEADLSEALVELAKDNLSNFTPHPAYSFFHYSHPALLERLDHLKRCAGT